MIIDVKKGIRFQFKLWSLLFCSFAIIAKYFHRKFAIITKMQRRPGGKARLPRQSSAPFLAPSLPCGPPVLISACSLVVWPHIQLCIKEKMKGKRKKGEGEFLLGKIATASRKDSLRKLKKNLGTSTIRFFHKLKLTATLPLVIAGWHNNDPCFPKMPWASYKGLKHGLKVIGIEIEEGRD